MESKWQKCWRLLMDGSIQETEGRLKSFVRSPHTLQLTHVSLLYGTWTRRNQCDLLYHLIHKLAVYFVLTKQGVAHAVAQNTLTLRYSLTLWILSFLTHLHPYILVHACPHDPSGPPSTTVTLFCSGLCRSAEQVMVWRHFSVREYGQLFHGSEAWQKCYVLKQLCFCN